MFAPFRACVQKKKTRVTLCALAATLAAFALFAPTAASYASPGVSAKWIAWVAVADVRDVASHPIFSAIGAWVANIPIGTLAHRLNLLCALFGALAAGCLFRIAWQLSYEWTRCPEIAPKAHRLATLAGILAPFSAILSKPFWSAATEFRPEIFDALLLFGSFSLICHYAQSKRLHWLLLFGIVSGAAAVESPCGLLALPLLWWAVIAVEWKIAWCRKAGLFAAGVLGLVAAVGITIWAGSQGWHAEAGGEEAGAITNSIPFLRSLFRELAGLFPVKLWIPVCIFGAVSALAACAAAANLLGGRASWSSLLLALALSAASVCMMCDLPFTPGAALARRGVLAAVPHAFDAIAFALLVAAWRGAVMVGTSPTLKEEEDDQKDDPDWDGADEDDGDDRSYRRGMGRAAIRTACACGIIALPALVGILGFSTWKHIDARRHEDGEFADRFAKEAVGHLGERSWAVANGLFDSHLLIAAKEANRTLHLLCPYRLHEHRYLDRTRTAITSSDFPEHAKLRAQDLLEANFHMFLDDFFRNVPDLPQKLVTFGLPDLWYAGGWTPVPETCFYSGAKTAADAPAEKLFAQSEEFLTRWKEFLAKDVDEKAIAEILRVRFRDYMAMLLNNLGVLLDEAGKSELAYRSWRDVLSIAPDHVSALLNLFGQVSRGKHPEDREWLENSLKQKVNDPRQRYPLWALSHYYGYVRNYELFVRMGWSWALSSSPESVLAGLRQTYSLEDDAEKRQRLASLIASLHAMRGDYTKGETEWRKVLEDNPGDEAAIGGLMRLALQQNKVETARELLVEGEKNGADKRRLRGNWAALAVASGDFARARILLTEICDEPDASPMSLAMLASVMLEQGDLAPVEHKILPAIIQRAGGEDNYFAQIVRGRLFLSRATKDPRALENARACYLRAYAMRPDVLPLLRSVLNLDVQMKDRRNTILHALSLLRSLPNDPYGNFILGTIRLEDAQFGDAEEYLKKACADEKHATISALNNYASVLMRIKRMDEAERVAQLAVKKDEKRYETWSTLASVLAQRGKADEAEHALAQAWKLHDKDTRLYLVEAAIALLRGQADTARKALAAIGEPAEDWTRADREEMSALEAQAGKQN